MTTSAQASGERATGDQVAAVAALPAGSLIEVTAEIRIPIAATEKQIREYLEYAMTESGGVSLDNPLLNESIDAWSFECRLTGYTGRREEFDHKQEPDGSKTYRVRRYRDRIARRSPDTNAQSNR